MYRSHRTLSAPPKECVSCPELRFCFKLIIVKQKLYESNESGGFMRAGVICGRKEQPVWLHAVNSVELPNCRH